MKKVIAIFGVFCLGFPFIIFAQHLYTLPTVQIDVTFKRLGDILFYLLVLLAFVFVLFGGITIATAGGDPNKVETGKKMVIFALVGIAIGAVAFGLVNLFYGYLANR